MVVGWRGRLCNICGFCKGETQNFWTLNPIHHHLGLVHQALLMRYQWKGPCIPRLWMKLHLFHTSSTTIPNICHYPHDEHIVVLVMWIKLNVAQWNIFHISGNRIISICKCLLKVFHTIRKHYLENVLLREYFPNCATWTHQHGHHYWWPIKGNQSAF